MSLDVSLLTKEKIIKPKGSGIFIRENGTTIEISEEDFEKRFPGRTPVRYIGDEETDECYSANITHNLGEMADRAGLYYALWRPEEKGWIIAEDIIPVLEKGLKKLQSKPKYFKKFNPDNGWGSYDVLVSFVESYLSACKKYRNSKIRVSR